MKGFRLALSFLTVFPAGSTGSSAGLGPARAYFPLVGLLLGAVLAGIDLALRPVFPPLLTGAVLIAALLALTRALHVEGFMDCCDGLLGGYTRERRLEIMRDSHVGSFAVIGAVALLLVEWTAIVGLPGQVRLQALVLFPCLSRWGMLVAVAAYPYARPQGLGGLFLEGRHRGQVIFAFATALVAGLWLAGSAGIALLALSTLVSLGLGRWMSGLLGGLTGDSYGAVNEVCQVAVLLGVIILAAGAPSLFRYPFSWGA